MTGLNCLTRSSILLVAYMVHAWINFLTVPSTLLAVYSHNAGFLAQPLGVAYCIMVDKTYTELRES